MGTGNLHDCMMVFVGGGVMAEGMIKALLRAGEMNPSQIVASDPRVERREALRARHGAKVTGNNLTAIAQADVVILAIKPQAMFHRSALQVGLQLLITARLLSVKLAGRQK